MDLLLVNLVLLGYIERDLSALVEYCEAVSAATGVPIPPNYPVVGRDAFRTATGVHAAAVIKALRKKRSGAGRCRLFRRAGEPRRPRAGDRGWPDVGRSNVVFWLEKRGLAATEELVDRIFQRAKRASSVLTEEEIRDDIDDADD